MPNDKKEYQDVIEALSSVAKLQTTRNKLNKVRVKTEDDDLAHILENLIRQYDSASRNVTASADLKRSPFKEVNLYCLRMINEAKPQWQILAETAKPGHTLFFSPTAHRNRDTHQTRNRDTHYFSVATIWPIHA